MTDAPNLSRATLAQAALDVLADGRRLTMRTIADEVGVSTMAAYRHVDGREHLGALALELAFARRAAHPNARTEREEALDDLVIEAILALEPYPGLEHELPHATDHPERPMTPEVGAWANAIANRYGPAAIRLAGWLVRGALSQPGHHEARRVALRTAVDVATFHDARTSGHTPLGVAKPAEQTR